MIAVNVTHGIKPIEVEGETYALKKGEHAFIPSKLAGAMIKRGWAAIGLWCGSDILRDFRGSE